MMGTGKTKKDLEISLVRLYRMNQESPELDLVARYSPLIRLDGHESFMPLAAGYTIFIVDGRSPSFDRHIGLKKGSRQASFVVEYAIWWDWDINHLYEWEAASGLREMKEPQSIPTLEAFSRSISQPEQVYVEQLIETMRNAYTSDGSALKKQVEDLRDKVRKLEDQLQIMEAKINLQEANEASR